MHPAYKIAVETQVSLLKEKYNNCIVLVESNGADTYELYGDDALMICPFMLAPMIEKEDIPMKRMIVIPRDTLERVQLIAADIHRRVCVLEPIIYSPFTPQYYWGFCLN